MKALPYSSSQRTVPSAQCSRSNTTSVPVAQKNILKYRLRFKNCKQVSQAFRALTHRLLKVLHNGHHTSQSFHIGALPSSFRVIWASFEAPWVARRSEVAHAPESTVASEIRCAQAHQKESASRSRGRPNFSLAKQKFAKFYRVA